MPPPCEVEGGVDPDTGQCHLGMPQLYRENLLAVEVWGDMNTFGWDFVKTMFDLELTSAERGDLLVKLRTLADEAALMQKERSEKAKVATEARSHGRNPATR